MSHTPQARLRWMTLIGALLVIPMTAAQDQPWPDEYEPALPTVRDRIVSEADTFYNCYWQCDPENILNDPLMETEAAFQTVGLKRGVPYMVGGYDTLDSFLEGIESGMGAGDVWFPSIDPRCVGLNCSGFVSRAEESGKRSTFTYHLVSDTLSPFELRMGDLVVWYGHHARLFVRWIDDDSMIVYECTTSVYPGRVVCREVSWYPEFQPMRPQHIMHDPEPVILWIEETGPGLMNMVFDGGSLTGYRIQHSTDGVSWDTVLDEDHSGIAVRNIEEAIALDTDNFLRVAEVNASGELTPYSDVAAVRLGAASPEVLIVDGIDSWRHRNGEDNPSHEFLIPLAQSLGRLGHTYTSCANEAVVVNEVNLGDHPVVIWLTGEDRVIDESISRGEQYHIERYLEQGGCLLLSGANIATDLAHVPGLTGVTVSDELRFWDVTDQAFMNDYLHLDRRNAPAPWDLCVNGTLESPVAGQCIDLDDGAHGAYAPANLDSLEAVGGGSVWMRYACTDEPAAVAYQGTFGGLASPEGAVVTLGFPLETVHSDAQRDALLREVMDHFAEVPAP